MITSKMTYVWLCMVVLVVRPLNGFPNVITKLAALALRAERLVQIIASEHAHQVPSKKITLTIFNPKSPDVPDEISSQDVLGLTIKDWKLGNAHILISSRLKDVISIEQTRNILHELAHAYDPFLKSTARLYHTQCHPMENGFYPSDYLFAHYPYLKDDAQAYVSHYESSEATAAAEPLSYEWYADWQAIQWMKKLFPDEARELEEYQTKLLARNCQRSHSPEYPPLEVLVKWLKHGP